MSTELVIQEPEPSDTLLELVMEINNSWGNLKEKAIAVYNQALGEGFNPQQAKAFCFSNIEFLSKRSLYRVLPDECKDKRMQQVGQAKAKVLPIGNEDSNSGVKEPNLPDIGPEGNSTPLVEQTVTYVEDSGRQSVTGTGDTRVMKPEDGINVILYEDIAIQEFLYNITKLKSSVKRFGKAYLEISK